MSFSGERPKYTYAMTSVPRCRNFFAHFPEINTMHISLGYTLYIFVAKSQIPRYVFRFRNNKTFTKIIHTKYFEVKTADA